MTNWPIVLGSIFFLIVFGTLCLWPFLRHHRRTQHTYRPVQQQYTITEESGTQRKKKEHHTQEPPSYPIPYGRLARIFWVHQFDWLFHGYGKDTRIAAMNVLMLWTNGIAKQFLDWVDQGMPQAQQQYEPEFIEANVRVITTEPELATVQQEPASLSPLQLLNLEMLKGEGRIALYEVYALGLLAYLYNHLPPSGTVHRDNNKSESGWVGGQVISSTQWDQFIGSSNPNTQKGQGLLRRAGLLVERDLDGHRVTTFSTPDVGQAISILTQYLIGEQQGQTRLKDEQVTPTQEQQGMEKKKDFSDTELANYQWHA